MSLTSKINRFLWFRGPSRDRAENFAVKFLRKRGYKIICRNFETPFAEIDIIALRGDFIVFAEVKQRKTSLHGLPREAVGPQKQMKIRRSAELYLQKYKTESQPRFDVIEIYGDCSGVQKPKVEHLENAF